MNRKGKEEECEKEEKKKSEVKEEESGVKWENVVLRKKLKSLKCSHLHNASGQVPT